VAELQVASEVDFCLEGTEGWMKLHNEELIWKEQEVGENLHKEICESHFSPNIIRKIKSNRIRCAGHVGRVLSKLNAYILEDPKINDPVEEWAYPGTWYLYCSETNKIGYYGPNDFGSKGDLVKMVMSFGPLRNAGSFCTG
jgi:hypothetical protein